MVLRLVGPNGAEASSLSDSYLHLVSDKRFPVPDLKLAEAFLFFGGFLIENDGYVRRTLEPEAEHVPEMLAMSGVSGGADPDAMVRDLEPFIDSENDRKDIVAWLHESADDEARSRLGALGEEFVVAQCRDALENAGRPELASQVRRVSLVSDAYGYDVSAVRTTSGSKPRLIEVKTSGLGWNPARVYLTRHEFNVAMQNQGDWFLVLVDASREAELQLLGHLTPELLAPHAPLNRGHGRWETMRIGIPLALLTPGLPT